MGRTELIAILYERIERALTAGCQWAATIVGLGVRAGNCFGPGHLRGNNLSTDERHWTSRGCSAGCPPVRPVDYPGNPLQNDWLAPAIATPNGQDHSQHSPCSIRSLTKKRTTTGEHRLLNVRCQ